MARIHKDGSRGRELVVVTVMIMMVVVVVVGEGGGGGLPFYHSYKNAKLHVPHLCGVCQQACKTALPCRPLWRSKQCSQVFIQSASRKLCINLHLA